MEERTVPWREALSLLIAGNERFQNGLRSTDALLGHKKLVELAEKGQRPFGIVLSCSDSRVPAELIFDCGFGDLFVIRVAGNVVQPSQIASIEYGAKVLGANLLVIMGHSMCGAVQAALETAKSRKPNLGPNIDFLIELILPAVQRSLVQKASTESLLDACIKENVRATSRQIFEKSQMLRALRSEDRFQAVEAVFNFHTGKVELIEK